MAPFVIRPPCPECGSIRVRVIVTGATDDDEPLRGRKCDDCQFRFTTVEVVLPEGLTVHKLDTARKFRNREQMRRRRGIYKGGPGGNPGKPTPRLDVTIRVRQPMRTVA